MSVDNKKHNEAYGLTQALINVAAEPIVSTRNPSANDKAQFGQLWVNKSTGICFVLTRIVANSYTWYAAAQAAASYTAAGALSAGTTLTVTGASILTGGATIGTGLTVTAGGATITGASAITGSLLASTSIGAGTSLASGTTITAGSSISATTTITAGTGLTVTAGNCTLTNGNLVLSTAATYVSLPGPVFIRSGAGDPANGLALHIGDLYIKTNAATAATRIFVATAVGTWTNVTCAA